ncbi:7tm 6 domain containing protein, partial [Asbolus verrucosus]
MKNFDWKFSIRINILMLRLVGLWPEGDEIYKLNFYTLYSVISIVVFTTAHNFFQTVHIFMVYSDLEALAAAIFVTLTDLLAQMKIFYFTHNMSILKGLMIKLNCEMFLPKRESQRMLVRPSLSFWKMTYTMFWMPVGTTLFLWAIFPVLDGSVKQHRLPFAAWYPYDAKISPFYEITYFHQVISILLMATANLNMDMLIAALMVYIGAQCDLLCDDLRNLQEVNFNSALLDSIEHHKNIVIFAQSCNTFFEMIVLGQFFTSSVSIAVAMFQLTLVAPLSSECYSLLFYVGSITVQIFLYCWFGNEVEIKQHHLPFAAWYPFDEQMSPLFEITYIHQVLSSWVLAITTLNMDMLIVALMVYTGAQCDILCDDLRNLRDSEKSCFNVKLVHSIVHHNRIVNFAENCNKFFNLLVLAQFFVSAVSIAVAMFKLTLVEPFSSECYSTLFYVGTITMEIFLYCWFGNEVEIK